MQATPSANLNRLLDSRHSCRAFTPAPVPHQTIVDMLEMAAKTASWCNAQPWHVHVVEGARLQALGEALQVCAAQGVPASPDFDWPRDYVGVYQERRRACGWALYSALGIARGDRLASAQQTHENFRFFGAPHMAVLTSDDALGTFGAVDCGGWLANFMLAATSMGVATVAQAAVGSWPDVLRAHLDLDPRRRVVCGISFGYEDTAHAANAFRTTRAPVEQTTTWLS